MNSISIQERISAQSLAYGASLAGIARTQDLAKSHSNVHYHQDPFTDSFQRLPERPQGVTSILVLALSHPQTTPEMDWWDNRAGGTPGNRALMGIQQKMKTWLLQVLNMHSRPLPYQVENGGVFLKDTAVLAGMGVIGMNNLLVTPTCGPRVRLRAMFLYEEIEPTGAIDFAPCGPCMKPCLTACPQDSFRSGKYQRDRCQVQMRIDETNVKALPDDPKTQSVRYCRACELACPVGR